MAKKVYIVRHAKSSWSDLTLSDKARPLNSRGRKDAPRMAKYALAHGYVPEVIMSSTAVRAYTTAVEFAKAFELDDSKLLKYDSLYHAPAETYFESCYELADEVDSVMLFGHNPGITYLANEVSDTYIENVPTCGLLVIHYDGDRWSDISASNCRLEKMMVPKELADV